MDGTLINYNTIEAFKQADKQSLFQDVSRRVSRGSGGQVGVPSWSPYEDCGADRATDVRGESLNINIGLIFLFTRLTHALSSYGTR